MRVEFHAEAAREIVGAQAWYEERSLFAASAFLRELSTTVNRIREAPERNPRAEHGTRRILMERFPFTLYSRTGQDRCIVVAVAHQKTSARLLAVQIGRSKRLPNPALVRHVSRVQNVSLARLRVRENPQ
jgi:plasmid stabilization system protein ParE